jgi:O-antigen ligase
MSASALMPVPVAAVEVPSRLGTGQMHVLAAGVLFCFFMIPAPGAYGVPAAWLLCVGLALYLGGWRPFFNQYRTTVWAVLALIVINALAARVPGRALSGGYELLRCMSLMIPALLLVMQAERRLALGWMKAFAAMATLASGALYFWYFGQRSVMSAIYRWGDLHFGNVHNLINVSALSALCLVVILAHERGWLKRIVFGALLLFALWFQWILKSEGTLLAFVLCLLGWAAVRYAGALRAIALTGLVLGVGAYVVQMLWPEAVKAALGIGLGGFEIRSVLNARVLELVAQQPWFGYGMNNFKDLPEAAIKGKAFLYPHQIYLEALFSFGVLGSALFVAMLVGVFRHSSRQAVLTDPLAMLGFLGAVYMAGKGLTDMKLIDLQPLGIVMIAAAFMARPASGGRLSEQAQSGLVGTRSVSTDP